MLDRPNQRIRHQDLAAAGLNEDFRLAELGHGQADGAGLELHLADLWRFVRFGMGTQADALRRGEGRHIVNVEF